MIGCGTSGRAAYATASTFPDGRSAFVPIREPLKSLSRASQEHLKKFWQGLFLLEQMQMQVQRRSASGFHPLSMPGSRLFGKASYQHKQRTVPDRRLGAIQATQATQAFPTKSKAKSKSIPILARNSRGPCTVSNRRTAPVLGHEHEHVFRLLSSRSNLNSNLRSQSIHGMSNSRKRKKADAVQPFQFNPARADRTRFQSSDAAKRPHPGNLVREKSQATGGAGQRNELLAWSCTKLKGNPGGHLGSCGLMRNLKLHPPRHGIGTPLLT
ncbi:hypothetical protein JHW43_007435 [Diplocarpon mali]|nr:hypothetical protein JHW43_007435 [Diplocarpon mali]